jgi:hypothetical protein
MQSSAKYTPVSPTHANYSFQAYHNSDPGTIQISAPFNIEDSKQGEYWIAVVHYLRSLTKMFSGSDMKAGNPPPIVKLNGYGNYVFKNVPVVVTNFSVELNSQCDYIGVRVAGSFMGEIGGIADGLDGFANAVGGAIPGLTDMAGTLAGVASDVSNVAGLLGAFGVGGASSGEVSYVPTKSVLSITLQPVYSRDSVRKFSLDKFVSGGYLNSSVGYL